MTATMVLLVVVVGFGWVPEEVLGTVSALGVDLLRHAIVAPGVSVGSYPPGGTR